METFILAGGLGTRIKSQFPDLPKALVPIHGKPFLEWQIETLASQEFRQITLCLGYRADQIISHFGDGTPWGVTLTYSIESTPLGTAGALKQAASFFQETALVLNGDTYLNIDYRGLVTHHRASNKSRHPIGTLALMDVQDSTRYGEVVVAEDHRIIEFREKSPAYRGPGLINAGAYVLESDLLNYIQPEHAVSLEREIFPLLMSAGYLQGFAVRGHFVDIGTPEGVNALEELLQ